MESTAGTDLGPQAVVMKMVTGAWVTKVISEVTRLGVPDVVERRGALSAAEIVSVGGVNAQPEALERVLRASASVGVFTEDTEGRFGPTRLSEVLTSGSPDSVKKLVEAIGGLWFRFYTEFFEAIRTGEPQVRNVVGMDLWDYLSANPEEHEDFGQAMKENSAASLAGVLEHCNFEGVGRLVDVGGGFGHLALALVERYPDLQAVVLEVDDLIPVARERFPLNDPDVASRFEYEGGDMFESVPPAEVYVMKHIMHDWEDEKCIRILRNCRQSMQGAGRVISVDAVLPSMGNTGGVSAKLLDTLMLVAFTGRERTEDQWIDMYRAAGLEVSRITPIRDNFASIVEGVKT